MTNIYLITNKLNGQKYVGKTIHTIQHRFSEHCVCTADNHTYIDNAIKAHGKENFQVELLKECDDSEWQYWEHYYIKQMHSHWTEGGYNLSWGGDHNPMEDEEVKRRHAAACASESHREKQRKASSGKKHTLEARKRMCQIQKEVYSNPELRRKVKLAQPTVISVYMLDDNDNILKRFDSLMDACRYFNKDCSYSSAIKGVLNKRNKNGKRSKMCGYAWVRVSDFDDKV